VRTLIVGYGNVDRGDDGLGYHVISEIARRLAQSELEPYGDEPAMVGDCVGLWFQRQLVPEMAETLAQFDRVVFVDAHTGAFAEELRVVEVEPRYAPQSLTHHLSPETLLYLTELVSGRSPRAHLYSARGYEFDFCDQLSERTRTLANQVVTELLTMCDDIHHPR
jgi:hydrogenase maturation protease